MALGPALAVNRYFAHNQMVEEAITFDMLERADEVLLLNVKTMQIEQMSINRQYRESVQRYVAVTHSWGQWRTSSDLSQLQAIHEVPILDARVCMPNLASIAKYVDEKLQYEYMWIDWACVDQDDIVNQASDLKLQRMVYSLATDVIGILRGNIGTIFEKINEIVKSTSVVDFNVNSIGTMSSQAYGYFPKNTLMEAEEAIQLIQQERWLMSDWTVQESIIGNDFKCISYDQCGVLVETKLSSLIGYLVCSVAQEKDPMDLDIAFTQKWAPTMGIASLHRLTKIVGVSRIDAGQYDYMAPTVGPRTSLLGGETTFMNLTAACSDLSLLADDVTLISDKQCLWHSNGSNRQDIIGPNKDWHLTRIRFGNKRAYLFDPIIMKFTSGLYTGSTWLIIGSVIMWKNGSYNTGVIATRVTQATMSRDILHAEQIRVFDATQVISCRLRPALHECIIVGLKVHEAAET